MAPSTGKVGSGAAGAGPSATNSAATLSIGLSGASSSGLGPVAGVPSSVYPTDTIRDIAEAVGITGIKDNVAAALAADVEYRIREIVQDATKYMKHSKRDQLKTTDIDAALRARNIEPLYGFLPSSSGRSNAPASKSTVGPTFRRVQNASGVPLHYIEDEEIDFDKILDAGPRIGIGRGVGWGAHWLAIEGVQPIVPQNPSPMALAQTATPSGFMGPASAQASAPSGTAAKAVTVAGGDGQAIAKPLVKHILSRELQLYYERLTVAIINPPPEADEDLDEGEQKPSAAVSEDDGDVDMQLATDPATSSDMPSTSINSVTHPLKTFSQKGSGNHVRDAALASLRGDPGLHQLVPYLIQFVGSKVIEILRGGPNTLDEQENLDTPMMTREVQQITLADNHMLGVMLGALHAILVNPHIFVEPYLHQLMPSLLSILLTSSLAEASLSVPGADADADNSLITSSSSAISLRMHAAALLTHIVDTYGTSYPTLKPRIVATLLQALMTGVGSHRRDTGSTRPAEPAASPGTKLGALMALRRLGKSSFRVLLSDSTDVSSGSSQQQGRPLKVLGDWMDSWQQGADQQDRSELSQDQIASRSLQMKPLIKEVAGALHALVALVSTPTSDLTEEERLDTLRAAFGPYWLSTLVQTDSRARLALESELGLCAPPVAQIKRE